MTGVLSLNRGGDGRPAIPALANADMLASMMTLSGVLMALYRRKETGRGDLQTLFLGLALSLHTQRERKGILERGSIFLKPRYPPFGIRQWSRCTIRFCRTD